MRSPADLDWDHVRCFLTAARCGSLSAAAGALGMSIPTVARKIERLEADLGLPLLKRGAGGVVPTPAGEAVLEYAEPGSRYLSQIVRVARALRTGSQERPIRISSTEPMISDVLTPKLTELYAEHPGLRLEFDVDTAISDLTNGSVDIAVRLARPKSETLIARRLPSLGQQLFCSPSYLADRDPRDLDLQKEHLLWVDLKYGDIPENVWLKDRGLEHRTRIRSTSVRSLCRAAAQGAGIAPLPHFLAEPAGLVVLPHIELPRRSPWLVFHRDNRPNKTMQIVRNWIADACQSVYAAA
ncbi:MAG: LysR family transcriptional regulator [Pseudomonadota bacterium]